MMNTMRARSGFTLIELVVVIIIAAILAMIAMNAYGNYLARAEVQAAKTDLTALARDLENQLQHNLVYSTRAHTTMSASDIVRAYPGWHPSQAKHFTYTLEAWPTRFTLKAQGMGGSLSTCILELTESDMPFISGCGAVTTW
ncbi:MAG TPA: prepilin-type N-terminal cleavage/methylation domain-containing protein [Dyella sp.]|uniref:prepilin-type N-terminal cleavage/methylation domain-containing protein n=1 Tax=Dyella sp. TaxID=1869338 RepID=UPI002C2E0BD5|nr:prepilin-type N-terminal cleavage/methylation domain-containing protein [Dyella sp.]HUB92287.1 prepilin-type N-terminal cleavage/methylation domain-containing protein [Dyella sp.]